MNLKEAFRYQNFLGGLMTKAMVSIMDKDHSLTTIKTHKRHEVNPDVEDYEEVVFPEKEFPSNDTVISFMVWLVNEKEKLTKAIDDAKSPLPFDIDAEIEANKFRQDVNRSIRAMLKYCGSKRTEDGTGYKFNNEGNQTPYSYDIEVVDTEAYNRDSARKIAREMISIADNYSSKIDALMVNTTVEYNPQFDVNEDFADVMEEFTFDSNR